MSIFLQTFDAVAVLMTIATLGFWIVRRHILPEKAVSMLLPLVLDVALPCYIFYKILTGFHPDQSPGWWHYPLWWLGTTLWFGLLTLAAMPLMPANSRGEFSLTLLFQNAVFVPLVIIRGVFGDNSPMLADLFLFTLFFPLIFFNTAQFFINRRPATFAFRKVLNPITLATLLALVMRLAGWQQNVPAFIMEGVGLVGAMAAPLLLIMLGGSMYLDWQQRGRWHPKDVALFVCLKNILFPALTLVALHIINPPKSVAIMILLQSAVPPLTTIPLIVEREGGNRTLVNQFMLASFLASLITIPAALAFLL